jgi:hypothetical protein
MKNLMMTVAVAATLAGAGVVVAQQSQTSPGGGHMMHGGGMGSGMGGPGMMGGMEGQGGMQGGMPGQMRGGMGCMMMGGGAGHQSMGMTPIKGDRSPASLAFHAVNAKMHEAMDVTFTGDADRDFAAAMIAHHEGAIDMAKVVVAFGKDAEVKKLAEQIIQDQQKEVTWMKEWLAKAKK